MRVQAYVNTTPGECWGCLKNKMGNCWQKARKGKLTCWFHRDAEAAAQKLKAEAEQKREGKP